MPFPYRPVICGVLLAGCLIACEREVRSVDYYLANPRDREAMELSCVKEPEKHRSLQDCANAAEAQEAHLAQYLPLEPPAPE